MRVSAEKLTVFVFVQRFVQRCALLIAQADFPVTRLTDQPGGMTNKLDGFIAVLALPAQRHVPQQHQSFPFQAVSEVFWSMSAASSSLCRRDIAKR